MSQQLSILIKVTEQHSISGSESEHIMLCAAIIHTPRLQVAILATVKHILCRAKPAVPECHKIWYKRLTAPVIEMLIEF